MQTQAEKEADPKKVEENQRAADVAEQQRRIASDPANVKSSGKYRLRAEHIIADQHLMPGTEVGADTSYPWPGPPTPLMEGLDEPGKKEVRDLHQKLYARPPVWEGVDGPEMEMHAKRAEEQSRETESHPVSHAQAMERGKEWKGPVPQPLTATTKGGDTTGGLGVPTNVQVKNPNEEQYPKG